VRLIPKGWRDFQHYKNRNPPWIRLHRKLLDDRVFHSLPTASKALAPMLWLLASESLDGSINGNVPELAFRLRQTEKEIDAALKPLISKGFFVVQQDASSALADCAEKPPIPETETETETEGETEAVARKRAAPEDVEPQVWTDWVALRRGKRANVSQTAIEEARKEAAKAGVSFNAFLRIWCRRGSQGLEASWLKADEISAGRKELSFAERASAAKSERLAEMTGGLLGAPQRPSNVIDMEEGNAPLRIA
jgi:hypothetical protein